VQRCANEAEEDKSVEKEASSGEVLSTWNQNPYSRGAERRKAQIPQQKQDEEILQMLPKPDGLRYHLGAPPTPAHSPSTATCLDLELQSRSMLGDMISSADVTDHKEDVDHQSIGTHDGTKEEAASTSDAAQLLRIQSSQQESIATENNFLAMELDNECEEQAGVTIGALHFHRKERSQKESLDTDYDSVAMETNNESVDTNLKAPSSPVASQSDKLEVLKPPRRPSTPKRPRARAVPGA
jgi:hypothetical protein